MLKYIFPKGYKKLKKLGEKRIIGRLAVGCLGSWFALIPIIFTAEEPIGLIVIGLIIIFILFTIIGIGVTTSGLAKDFLDDIVDHWPTFLHEIIIGATIFLLVIVTITFYEHRKPTNQGTPE